MSTKIIRPRITSYNVCYTKLLRIFDRHHLHRMTTLGYEGAMYMLTTLVNAVMEKLDSETMELGKTDYNFDLVR